MHILFAAVGIAVLLEGIMPFVSPRLFRRSVASMLQVSDRGLRVVGLTAIIAGVVLVCLVNAL